MSVEYEPIQWPNENEGHVVLLDVCSHLEAGREPFPAIMAAVETLEPGQVLFLRAPFEPLPLYSVMAGKGFVRQSRKATDEKGGDCWEVLFCRNYATMDSSKADSEPTGDDEPLEEGLVEIELRGVEPPEQTERVLRTLDGMRYDDVLLVHDDGEPERFYRVLTERGFSHRAERNSENDWLIRIWRNR